MRKAGIFLIRVYQWSIRPLIGATCRFYPSCSEYAAEAILKYGLGKGCWMALKRIGKCHPYHCGGYDPVE